jgi:hypothetical protein
LFLTSFQTPPLFLSLKQICGAAAPAYLVANAAPTATVPYYTLNITTGVATAVARLAT